MCLLAVAIPTLGRNLLLLLCEPSRGGANSVDADGWTPLHHAVQAIVCWPDAHTIAITLVDMMTVDRLRATTTGGRPAGWSALHTACNGSDKGLRRAELVPLLVAARCDVDDRDSKGRTPLHFVADTGVVQGLVWVDNYCKFLTDHGFEPSGVSVATRYTPKGKYSDSRRHRLFEKNTLSKPDFGFHKGAHLTYHKGQGKDKGKPTASGHDEHVGAHPYAWGQASRASTDVPPGSGNTWQQPAASSQAEPSGKGWHRGSGWNRGSGWHRGSGWYGGWDY